MYTHPVEPETPLRFGRRKQLLVDNEVLCDWWRMRRIQEKVKKHPANPLVVADQPWEMEARENYGVLPCWALYDEEAGRVKMWYSLQDGGLGPTAYAESEDGITWDKPPLGLAAYGGIPDTNLCLLQPAGKPLRGYMNVHYQPDASDPHRRYRAIGLSPYHPEDGGPLGGWAGVAFSADGFTWNQVEGGLRLGGGGGDVRCVWDEDLGRWVGFIRQLKENADPTAGTVRYITRIESEDFLHWSPRQTCFNPMDSRWPEVEGMPVFLYEGLYIGLPQMLDMNVTGEVEIHLTFSRDGFRWEHPFPDEAFIPRGPRGDFDDLITWFGTPVVRDGTIGFYYGGARYPHSAPALVRPNNIGLATVPLDRMIGLRADEPPGAFLTRPFVVEGEGLEINANVDRELTVEVVDPVTTLKDIGPKGKVIQHYIAGEEHVYPGFTQNDCTPIVGDSLRHRIQWNGGSIDRFRGEAVRLRFRARMATLYAFQIQ